MCRRVLLLLLLIFLFSSAKFIAQEHKIYVNSGILHASVNFEKKLLNYGQNNSTNAKIGLGTFEYAAIRCNAVTIGIVQNFNIKKSNFEVGFGCNSVLKGYDKRIEKKIDRFIIVPQFNVGYKYQLFKQLNIKTGIGIPEFIYIGIEYLF